jgi:hypothetical protein
MVNREIATAPPGAEERNRPSPRRQAAERTRGCDGSRRTARRAWSRGRAGRRVHRVDCRPGPAVRSPNRTDRQPVNELLNRTLSPGPEGSYGVQWGAPIPTVREPSRRLRQGRRGEGGTRAGHGGGPGTRDFVAEGLERAARTGDVVVAGQQRVDDGVVESPGGVAARRPNRHLTNR